jgi:hypothetical protein
MSKMIIDTSNNTIKTDSGNITIEPAEGANLALGNFVFNVNQTLTATEDGYVLTYDDVSGVLSFQQASGGGGGGGGTPGGISGDIQYNNAGAFDGTTFQFDAVSEQLLGPNLANTSSPDYSFSGDDDTGMYSKGDNTISWAAAGQEGMSLTGVVNEGSLFTLTVGSIAISGGEGGGEGGGGDEIPDVQDGRVVSTRVIAQGNAGFPPGFGFFDSFGFAEGGFFLDTENFDSIGGESAVAGFQAPNGDLIWGVAGGESGYIAHDNPSWAFSPGVWDATTYANNVANGPDAAIPNKKYVDDLIQSSGLPGSGTTTTATPDTDVVITFANPVTGTPDIMQMVLTCVTADLGFSPGDTVHLNAQGVDFDEAAGPSQSGHLLSYDASTDQIRVILKGLGTLGSEVGIAQYNDTTVNNLAQITPANWDLVVKCLKF